MRGGWWDLVWVIMGVRFSGRVGWLREEESGMVGDEC